MPNKLSTKKTKIEWTDYSWNPWQGCRKVSAGCANCYMYRDKKRYGQDGSEIYRSSKATFEKPLKLEDGATVFACSWSDFFIEEADAWRDDAWDIIRRTPNLTYLILTKRPENMAGRLPDDWGENFGHVWLGVTAENQEAADKRIPTLIDTPAAHRFVSLEPLIGEVGLTMIDGLHRGLQVSMNALDSDWSSCGGVHFDHPTIEWVIVGGETGAKSKARPMKREWVDTVYQECVRAGVPFFFKQEGAHKLERSHPMLEFDFEWVKEFPWKN